MSKLTLDRAKEILEKHTTEEHLFHHAAAVSAAMGAMAEAYGEDKDYKRFAAKCNREIIDKGIENLGMELSEVMNHCIKGMTEHSDEIGL